MLGFLRETKEMAIKAGLDKQTGLIRSGLDEYLSILYPGVEWVHDQPLGRINGVYYRCRPDYRNDELMLIIEFDGIQHYQTPQQILQDIKNTQTYNNLGYKVIRIPYFIQLTSQVIKVLFDKDFEDLFPQGVPSLGMCPGDPSCLCHAGVNRMAQEYLKFPEQYETNIKALEKYDDFLSGASLLREAYEYFNINS